jgi:hypothetical protein
VRAWSDKTEIAVDRFIAWIGVARGKFFAWRKRYGKANEHNGLVPRDHWLLDEEKRKIIAFHDRFPLEGYRRLTFMMLDQDVVATSPSSVYRVLAGAGLLDRWNKKPSKKGTGFVQPLRAHEHWHIHIAYLNLAGTFYYMCSRSGTFDDPTPTQLAFLAKYGGESKGWLFNKKLRYIEPVIEPGERIAVLGSGVREPDPQGRPAEGYRSAAPTRLRLTSTPHPPLVISDDASTTDPAAQRAG